jgi:hypothetical protein
LDITLETLISLIILCVGLVLQAPPLRPIQWRVWAGIIEREGGRGLADPISAGKHGEGNPEGKMANPFLGLVERGARSGFVDVRGLRKEFTEWAKEGTAKGSAKSKS